MHKYDLGFGDPVIVREALCEFIDPRTALAGNYLSLGYGDKSGHQTFLYYVKRLIKEFTGKDYKYNFISNGATGGVNVALKALLPMTEKTITMFPSNELLGSTKPLVYFRTPAFHYYQDMVRYSGYNYTKDPIRSIVRLIDSPRNPTGEIDIGTSTSNSSYIVWDAAYHSPIYNRLFMNMMPVHDIMVGSFGKTTGLTGMRLGWISTDSDLIARLIEKALHADSLGTSQYAQAAGADLLVRLPTDKFFSKAASMIDDNREEMMKVRNLFGVEVPFTGMFYYAPVSGYLEKVLKDMGTNYVPSETMGDLSGWGRFSLAQKREVVRDFVKELKRRDG